MARAFSTRPALSAVVGVTLVVAACGRPASSTKPSPSAGTPAGALVKTAHITVAGQGETVLTDDQGKTLYYYSRDKGGKVTCTGDCAATWPPVILPAGTTKPSGVGLAGALGAVTNPIGGRQVTYDGWPLYSSINDEAPGDANG